jgi:uncharacterized Ntn-hydrolase superfamily protein
MAGVAITTSSICVGSRCPHVLAGAGAVTTQNVTDPSIGPEVLAHLAAGASAEAALAAVMTDRPHSDYRQVAVVDLAGNVAHVTGAHILGTNAVATGADMSTDMGTGTGTGTGTGAGTGCVAAGNLLSSRDVPTAMVASFAAGADLHLADRLLTALQAGIDAGGEEGPTHSAALLVAHRNSWPLVDLRVDWTEECPGLVLRRLWDAYEPQMEAYNLRALDPSAAPSYGVAGDE